MKQNTTILSITGSDNTGVSGIQADIKTIQAMQGYALTAVTAVTIQNAGGMLNIMDLPKDMVVGQVKAIVEEFHPKAIKIGLLRDVETIKAVRNEVIGCKNLILVPGILNSQGQQLMKAETLEAWKKILIPEAFLIQLRCSEAELLLNMQICSDNDMIQAAKRLVEIGAKAVLLRGGHQVENRLTALLYHDGTTKFFSSENTEGWQKHGVGGTLSAAIATRLAFGDTLKEAISKAHDYMHAQVVFGVKTVKANRKEITERSLQRKADIYNEFMTLIAQHYREAHDVAFYADKLALTTRYLSKVTTDVVDSSPKQLIFNYIMQEACSLLRTSRLSMSEISAQLGFSSESRFVTLFRKQKGMSPGEWRRKSNH